MPRGNGLRVRRNRSSALRAIRRAGLPDDALHLIGTSALTFACGREAGASLAALPERQAVAPFGIGAVDVDAEDDALVARRTIAAVAVKRRKRILAAVHIVERAEEQLPFARP